MDEITFLRIHNISPRIERGGKKTTSCEDYVLEKKLQRIIKSKMNDSDVINDLIGKRGFGRTKVMVINNIKNVVNNNVRGNL